MIKRYQLTLTLLEDGIFSERAASEGGHRSLDYIPGITLLGACASKIYQQLGSAAFDVFHSGKVRFGNAYPLSISGEKSLPVPFAWHGVKGRESSQLVDIQRHRLIAGNILNLAKTAMPKGKQPKQLRQGYITDALELIQPETSLRMKTAINPETATAAKSQLFGYQAIQAGQCFSAYLDFDIDLDSDNDDNKPAGIDQNSIDRVLDALSGELFLGRSRTAQYGAVKCEISEQESSSEQHQPVAIASDTEITLWFLSDCALLDQYGVPVTAATLKIPGLESATILWDKSQLRFRRYSPYNSKRRKFDLERQVIEKGSVLSLKPGEELSVQQQNELQRGIGIYREAGLGQIAIQHPLLETEKPVALAEIKPSRAQSPDMPRDSLARFLSQLHQSSKASRKDREYAEQKAQELKKLYQRAYAYAAVDFKLDLGPSASQWSRIVEAGKQYQFEKDKQKLLTRLFGNVSNKDDKMQDTICKQNDEAWRVITFDNNNRELTFRKWLYDTLRDKTVQQPSMVAILLAKKATDIVRQIRKVASPEQQEQPEPQEQQTGEQRL